MLAIKIGMKTAQTTLPHWIKKCSKHCVFKTKIVRVTVGESLSANVGLVVAQFRKGRPAMPPKRLLSSSVSKRSLVGSIF